MVRLVVMKKFSVGLVWWHTHNPSTEEADKFQTSQDCRARHCLKKNKIKNWFPDFCLLTDFWFYSLFRIHALCVQSFWSLVKLHDLVSSLPGSLSHVLGWECLVIWPQLFSSALPCLLLILTFWLCSFHMMYSVTRIGLSVSPFPLPRRFCSILGLCSYLNMWFCCYCCCFFIY